MQFECLASWREGRNNFLVVKMEHGHISKVRKIMKIGTVHEIQTCFFFRMKSASDAFYGKLMGSEFPRTRMVLFQTMSGWPPSIRMTAGRRPPSCPSVGTPPAMASTPARRDKHWCWSQVKTRITLIWSLLVEKNIWIHECVLSEMTFDDLFQWAMMSYVPCLAGWEAAGSGRVWTRSSNWRLL